MLIHETVFTDAQSYRLTQIHDLHGHTVRVRVHRDSYLFQSWAAADVLTPALTWTELATTPAHDWHPNTPTITPTRDDVRTAVHDALRPVAADLTAQAHRLLRNLPAPTPAPLAPAATGTATGSGQLVKTAPPAGGCPTVGSHAAPTVTIEISNIYADGHVSNRQVTLPAPGDDLKQWWQDAVWPETGDGHHGDAHYSARIIRADHAPALLTLGQEWAG